MDIQDEQRAVIRFCVHFSKMTTEAYELAGSRTEAISPVATYFRFQ